MASLKPTTSPSKALKELLLCDRVPQTSAMLQGLESEDGIVDTLLSKMEMEGKHGFSFTKCGFLISKTHGCLGASPDRIIQDPEEDSPGVAELKFLQVKENEMLADVPLRQHICVKRKEDNCTSLLLNKNHKYYFQLYQQMFVKESWEFLLLKDPMATCFIKKLNLKNIFGLLY